MSWVIKSYFFLDRYDLKNLAGGKHQKRLNYFSAELPIHNLTSV